VKRLLALVAALLLGFSAPAFAAPIAYNNIPLDTIQSAVNGLAQSVNGQTQSAYLTSCTGSATATCPGLRVSVSYTGLTTAAGLTSATFTATDASVTAASQINCQVNGYAGTGIPITVSVVPAAGAFTFAIQNVSTTVALSATVVSACQVWN
jgi:hypothetical protein